MLPLPRSRHDLPDLGGPQKTILAISVDQVSDCVVRAVGFANDITTELRVEHSDSTIEMGNGMCDDVCDRNRRRAVYAKKGPPAGAPLETRCASPVRASRTTASSVGLDISRLGLMALIMLVTDSVIVAAHQDHYGC